MRITKREILFSIVIIAFMLIFGMVISEKINESKMLKQQEYNMAIHIEDKNIFKYSMDTNVGNALVYGELKAIDAVSYPDIEGKYIYVEQVKEVYTMHTRTITETINGKTTTRTETYYTWDYAGSENKNSKEVSFLDIKFNYGTIDLPPSNYIDTVQKSSNIRYVYYGIKDNYTGTLYAKLGDKTATDTVFYQNKTIEEVLNDNETNWGKIIFWIFWIVLIVMCVFMFYYFENRWLEDK